MQSAIRRYFVTAQGRSCTNAIQNMLKEGKLLMKILLNEDQEIVKTVKEGLERRGGYCPCRLESTEDTKCMCREFREQIADPGFEGYCHCMLYYKSLE